VLLLTNDDEGYRLALILVDFGWKWLRSGLLEDLLIQELSRLLMFAFGRPLSGCLNRLGSLC
jgi:hypothetical protein